MKRSKLTWKKWNYFGSTHFLSPWITQTKLDNFTAIIIIVIFNEIKQADYFWTVFLNLHVKPREFLNVTQEIFLLLYIDHLIYFSQEKRPNLREATEVSSRSHSRSRTP